MPIIIVNWLCQDWMPIFVMGFRQKKTQKFHFLVKNLIKQTPRDLHKNYKPQIKFFIFKCTEIMKQKNLSSLRFILTLTHSSYKLGLKKIKEFNNSLSLSLSPFGFKEQFNFKSFFTGTYKTKITVAFNSRGPIHWING